MCIKMAAGRCGVKGAAQPSLLLRATYAQPRTSLACGFNASLLSAYLTDCDGGLPVMTIKVYEVDREGGTRVIRPEAEVAPLDRPEYAPEYPACECPTCSEDAS